MRRIRCFAKHVSFFMILTMVFMTMPIQTVSAAMVDTETVFTITHAQNARTNLIKFLERKEVQAAMIAQGINPLEAIARVDSLSDAEVVRLCDQIEQLPAGGSDLGLVIAVVGVIFIILVITDALGYTDVFTFVKAQQ